MKKSLKLISIVISICILFVSCGQAKPENVTNKIKTYLDANDYRECKTYISSVDSEIKTNISETALALVSEEFADIYKPYCEYDIFDIAKFDASFIEKCVNLWRIATEFTPNEEKSNDFNLCYLRYFSGLQDVLMYQEMFRMIKNMYSSGYLYSLQNALHNYEEFGEYKYFETAKETLSSFKFSEYNPNEYYITELRTACESLNKYLISVNNGFATNDTVVIASAVNNIYDSSDILLYACDSVEEIYNLMADSINIFKSNGAFAEYKNEIKSVSKRKFSEVKNFPVTIFGDSFVPPDFGNADVSENEGTATQISKNEAIKIAVNAINKTKGYKSEITVNRIQTVNIQMTSFKTESEITSAVTLVKVKINDALKQYNGTSKESKHFANGECEDLILNSFIPPASRTAYLDPSLVENYTAVKGSGGYVISFNLKACTSPDDSISQNLFSIVDGFYFDREAQNIQHKTFYSPTAISLVVNNFGMLSKYEYTVGGVANCKFSDNGEQVATGEFSFKQQYNYTFIY